MALRKKVTAVGNSAAIVLSRDLLQLLDLEIGAEVELSVTDKTLVVRSAREAERAERVKAAADRVFERRRDLLERLAEGAGGGEAAARAPAVEPRPSKP
jgi:antitoxin component of MazEF toxin-antitoxin module